MSVSVSGLTKVYNGIKAVDGISFSVKPGEVLGFLGPNGAGKSTTMKIITGYIPATSGTATVCGFDTDQQSLEARRRTGYLPENNPLYADMYVREFLEFASRLNQVPDRKKRIAALIETVGLEGEQKKKIGTLSKGYRQRVGLAQALLHDPEVLIMDEPTSGLDPNQLAGIRQLIKSLGTKKTVILSTHIMQEVQAVCSRVVILHKGRIVADRPIQELGHKVEGQVVLVAFRQPVPREALLGLAGVNEVEETGNNHWRIRSEIPVQEALFRFAVEQGNVILSLQQEQESLEDVFRQLTASATKPGGLS